MDVILGHKMEIWRGVIFSSQVWKVDARVLSLQNIQSGKAFLWHRPDMIRSRKGVSPCLSLFSSRYTKGFTEKIVLIIYVMNSTLRNGKPERSDLVMCSRKKSRFVF
jgi:hypothetical protein